RSPRLTASRGPVAGRRIVALRPPVGPVVDPVDGGRISTVVDLGRIPRGSAIAGRGTGGRDVYPVEIHRAVDVDAQRMSAGAQRERAGALRHPGLPAAGIADGGGT